MVGRNRFVQQYAQASKNLRTGGTKKKGLGKSRKAYEQKQRQEQARRTGTIIGALRQVFKGK